MCHCTVCFSYLYYYIFLYISISFYYSVDHGKSTLTDSLVSASGFLSESLIGDARYTDMRQDEQERGVTIKSTSVTLYYEKEYDNNENQKSNDDDLNGYLINLIDCPGHIDFSSEVTASLRITDGALVVIDCIEGVCVQTETVLRQALAERVVPILMINKIDRGLLELQMSSEEAYLSFQQSIDLSNTIISTFNDDNLMGDLQVHPENETVSFGSGLQGWAFTLGRFADMYSKKFNVERDKLIKRLWGDHYFDPSSKKWYRTPLNQQGKSLKRGFVQFIMDPIIQLFKSVMDDDVQKYTKMIKSLGITLKSDEKEERGKSLLKIIMRKWLPASDTLFEMIVSKLPSPVKAQKYRVDTIYDGPTDDDAYESIKNCDPNGVLMCFISKMIPTNDKGRFYSFGRVFSGTLSSGMKVRILGPQYKIGSNNDLSIKNIQRMVLMMGRNVENIEKCPCGNTVGILGIDQFILKTATITTSEHAHVIKSLTFSVSPVVRVAVEPRHPVDLPKLIEGMSKLSKSDPLVKCSTEETGEHIISCAGELHLEICLKDLKDDFACIDIIYSDPIVEFRETVRQKSSKNVVMTSKMNNFKVEINSMPLDEDISNDIDKGKMNDMNFNQKVSYVSDKIGLDKSKYKIWCFGPNKFGPNILVDSISVGKTQQEIESLQSDIDEVRDPSIVAFQWVTKQGPLIEENLRSVRFNIIDIECIRDKGGGSIGSTHILPTVRRCLYASLLHSKPTIMEPVYNVDILCPESVIGQVYSVVTGRKGDIYNDEIKIGDMHSIKAYLPVKESFGFTTELRTQTQGRSFDQSMFDHWEVMEGDPYDDESRLAKFIRELRRKRGLRSDIPSLEDYMD